MYSPTSVGDCVEVASLQGPVIALRDSKDPGGPKLLVPRDDFRRFAQALKDAWRPTP
ncbi:MULTISPECIES: DUF397 domain-containing protein [Thermomonosporaceae]|uniref:DUF397 domain-containing protein n=1 Tax=Thermomonosporaceae TaxID=2012 RepID=UPI00255B1F04|nr:MULTISPECIES: DUF397 domain-containing protein [Thermomonosporaceae]MDL4773273.1 DUF397 domain-containing protein [Actinomadura xylanilytica]